MKINLTDINPTKVSINVIAEEKDLAPVKKHVLSHFSKTVKVPGFRQGTAPLPLVEKNISQQAFLDEFLEHAINDLYKKVLDCEKIRPIGQPELSIKKFVPYTSLEFVAEQEVIGKMKLPNYKLIKLAKPKVTVSDADVNEIISTMQTRMAEKKEKDGVIANGDEANIDFYGTDLKGEPIPGADGKGYDLAVGSKTFIPGFEEELIGLKAGAEKNFEITFPADYHSKDLQSKKVNFKVTINKVNELTKPKLDDEFAKKIGPVTSFEELKKDIKNELLAEKQKQAEKDYESDLVKKIAEKSTVHIPETLVNDQLDSAELQEKQNLMYSGKTWQEHLKEEGVTDEEHRAKHRPEAEERIKASLILSEISELEKVDVTPAELNERIAELKAQYQDPEMQKELDKPENRRDIAARILTDKTLEKLKQYAAK